MSLITKVSRPKRLDDNDANSVDTYEDWKDNLIFYLAQDSSYACFLKDNVTWGDALTPNRGFSDDATTEKVPLSAVQKAANLNRFLGIIVQCAPQHCRSLITNSVSLNNVWSIIKDYLGLRQSESQFLKLNSIKMEHNERYQHLYHRLRSEHEQCLMKSDGNLLFKGAKVVENEIMSPTHERLVVLRWLELIDPRLPEFLMNEFSTDLSKYSVMDLQKGWAENMGLLLAKLNGFEDSNVKRVNTNQSSFSKKKPNNFKGKSNFSEKKVCILCKEANYSQF